MKNIKLTLYALIGFFIGVGMALLLKGNLPANTQLILVLIGLALVGITLIIYFKSRNKKDKTLALIEQNAKQIADLERQKILLVEDIHAKEAEFNSLQSQIQEMMQQKDKLTHDFNTAVENIKVRSTQDAANFLKNL